MRDAIRQVILSMYCYNPIPEWELVVARSPILEFHLVEAHNLRPLPNVCAEMEEWEENLLLIYENKDAV